MVCSRCHRSHTGVCGIPPSVTLKLGLRGIRKKVKEQCIDGKPINPRLGTAVLEKLLAGAQEQYNKVQDMLKEVPYELPEFSQLLDRETKLNSLIKQLYEQIGVRKSK